MKRQQAQQKKETHMVKVAEFLESKGMNYFVQKEQATRQKDGKTVEIDGQYHLVRSTDGEVISPSTVSERYSAYNPIKMCEPMAPLVSEGWITPDKGFLFKRGSYEVVSFSMDAGTLHDQGRIAGEDWVHWISLHNHQGGGGGLKGSITSFRVVCKNTAAAAARGACFTIRHTGDIDKNYKWAVDQWSKLKDEIRKLSKRMEVFADTKVSAKEALDVMHKLYDVKPGDKPSTRTQNELDFAMKEFANPTRGTYGRSIADVYNAITSTNSHYSAKTAKEDTTKRLASIYDPNGSRHKLEVHTLDILESMVGV